jgi:acetyltransferase-like isoleucine patch superfamily enzyme
VDALFAYRRLSDLRTALFSRLVAGAFESFGRGSQIVPPVRLDGEPRIAIGRDVYIGPASWLLAIGDGRLEIGDGTRMSGLCVLSAAARVTLGREVLLGSNVYVADHSHGISLPDVAIMHQKLEGIAPVEIRDGAWLGQNAVVLSGVTVGAGAVVGANSVVLEDVEPRTVVAGAPARVVKQLPR